MSLNLANWKYSYGLVSGPTLHIGASLVQERYQYELSKMEPVLWVEALHKIAEQAQLLLTKFSNQKLIQAVVSDFSGKSVVMNCASNNGESSSLLESKMQSLVHPDITFEPTQVCISITVDDLVKKHFPVDSISLLVLDVQGAELSVLKGAPNTLEIVQFVFTEVSTVQMYKDQPLFKEISKFLDGFGFCLIEHNLRNRTFHGDALYIKKELAVARGIKTHNSPQNGNLYYLFLIHFRRLKTYSKKIVKI